MIVGEWRTRTWRLRPPLPPPVASHSGVRRIADHHRNLPDDLLELLARRDGVLGVVFFSGYLDAEFWRAASEIGARLEAEGVGPCRIIPNGCEASCEINAYWQLYKMKAAYRMMEEHEARMELP